MIIYSIYAIVNTLTGKHYIGYTKNIKRRFCEHMRAESSRSTTLAKAIRKYGKENFNLTVIYQSLDGEHCMNEMESYFIRVYDSYENGYNMTAGGEGTIGYKRSKESNEKQSVSRNHRFGAKDEDGNVFYINSDDPRFVSGQLCGLNKGRKATLETKLKHTKSMMGNTFRSGYPHSDETKRIISERTSLALKGKAKNRICRIHDHKEMTVANYTIWLNKMDL